MANYLVATFGDRPEAEAAYTALETKDFPLRQVTLLGAGHQSWVDYPLFDPNQALRQRLKWVMAWLIPFGFFAGFAFNQITQLTILSSLGSLANGAIGGLMGAGSGALGSLMVSGGIKLLLPGQDTLTYRQRLQTGKYLLVIKGSEFSVGQAYRILRSLRPESLQVYESPEPD